MDKPGAMGEGFWVVSVEPADAPGNLGGTGWHRYVIGQGTNRICGYRQGSHQAILNSVENLVLRSNERRLGKKARDNPRDNPDVSQ